MDEEGDSMTTIVDGRFPTAHSGIVSFHRQAIERAVIGIFPIKNETRRRPVVGHENENGILGEFEVGQFLAKASHVVIDVGDHAEEVWIGDLRVAFVRLGPFFRNAVGAVWGVEREIEEEGLCLVFFDKAHAFAKPNIGAVALELFELSVSLVGVVKVVVAPVVGGLPDATAAMPDDILKAAILRAMGRVVTEMPFAHHAGGVARVRKEIGDGFFVPMHHRATGAGAEGASVTGVVSGHQCGARRSADGTDVKVSEANRLCVEPIEMWGFQNRIPVAAQVTIPLVVRHDDDHVRRRADTIYGRQTRYDR